MLSSEVTLTQENQGKEQKFPLRVPMDVYKDLQEVARLQRRSLNSLIVAVMEQYAKSELEKGKKVRQ